VSLPLARPSLRRQDFDHVLDAMVHDRLASGEVTRSLCREAAKALRLKEVLVLASVADSVRRIVAAFGLAPGDRVVLSPLAPPYWAEGLVRLGVVPLFCDVCEGSPVLDPALVQELLPQEPKLIVADACLGYLPDVEALAALGLPVVEDLSHGLGGRLNGVSAGTRGAAVVIQFAPETLVAGAGGSLAGFRTAPDAAVLETAPWEALSDLGSALILSQWRDAEAFAEKKREHFRHLFHRLPKAYRQPRQIGDGEPVMPWFPVLVESGAREVLAYSRKKAVEADWAFRNQPHLNADSAGDFCPKARSFLFHTLLFPLYATFSLKELDLLGKVISSLP
jgi:dTDP-4-amino-4,6-dideoxygalactose transaminase